MTDPPDDVVDAWPMCPECQTARVAVCRVCGAAKDYFPSAFQHEGENHGLRYCSSCDDVGQLNYYRHCHQCGHDYGSGIEPNRPLEDHENLQLIRWILIAMAAGTGLAVAYFYWLFRR
jgi:hypothetical protein